MKLQLLPMSLREASEFVQSFHRHPPHEGKVRGKFAMGASDGDQLWGVVIVGRPLARLLNDGYTAEVLRLCSRPGAPKGTNSFLYAKAWRAWEAQGGRRIVTYTLESESGASLRGVGWKIAGKAPPRPYGWKATGRERRWNPAYGQAKLRWEHPDFEEESDHAADPCLPAQDQGQPG
jgi:hypothetical protein